MNEVETSTPPADFVSRPPAPPQAATELQPILVQARPIAPVHGASAGLPACPMPQYGGTDKCAVASAVCGFTAIIPVISQIAGVVLGIIGLVRIHRAKARNEHLRGTGWAIAGLVMSGCALLGWIAAIGLLTFASVMFTDAGSALEQLSRHTP